MNGPCTVNAYLRMQTNPPEWLERSASMRHIEPCVRKAWERLLEVRGTDKEPAALVELKYEHDEIVVEEMFQEFIQRAEE